MKHLALLSLFGLIFTNLQAQKKFEGYIFYRFFPTQPFIADTNSNIKVNFNFSIGKRKDSTLVLKLTYKERVIISESLQNDTTFISSYYDFDKANFLTYCDSEHCQKLSLKNINYSDFKIMRTNEKKKIAGYQCEKYLVQKVNSKTKTIMTQQIWVTQEIENVPQFPLFDLLFAIPDNFLWFYPSIKGFPVRIEFPFCLEDKPEFSFLSINPCEFIAFAWELEKITPQKISKKEIDEKIEKLKNTKQK